MDIFVPWLCVTLNINLSLIIRQWGTHFDLHHSHLLALAAAERHLLESEYEDYISSSIACLCSIAIIVSQKKKTNLQVINLSLFFLLNLI